MRKIYILAPVRTGIGSFGGSLKDIPAYRLGAEAIRMSLSRAGVMPEQADQVLMGNVLQAGQGQNPARQAAIAAGIPAEKPAMTLNKVCGSGLTSVSLAAALIRAGEADCIVAGGMESMSGAPYYLSALRSGARLGNTQAVDAVIHDGLWDAFHDYHMGITAENIAEQYGITREEQDAFALDSQQKAADAKTSGRFQDEIIPVEIPQRKGSPKVFAEDEYIRMDASAQSMAKLRPAFQKDGTVTAANASGINDGAAAMLVVSEEFVRRHSLNPIAVYLAGASCGVAPAMMGLGPVPSIRKALEKAHLSIDTVGLFEANEAFAAQAIAVSRELELPPEKVNVNGGAIALGHPIGASGARITVTLLHEMRRCGVQYGVSALCIGGGMGEAAVFARDALCTERKGARDAEYYS